MTKLSAGEIFLINLDIPKFIRIPFKIQYAKFLQAVNVNSSFQNTTVLELVNSTVIEEEADATILNSFGGPVNNLGYLANNREGLSINTETM